MKACAIRSAGKQMYVMFADRKGMILCHAVPTHTHINADYYSKVFAFNFSALIKQASFISIT
jgi:hypothetical protein